MNDQDKKEELLSDIAHFLEDEQEIYGPLTFSEEGEDDILTANNTGLIKEEPEAHYSSTLKENSGTESATESVQEQVTEPKKEHITLQAQLEACNNLDDLRLLCEESDELRTDLKGTNLVFGVGNPNADLMLIGEAPGEQEDQQGEPFVGAAGQLLNKILAAIQFKREDVYIANILKHRPPGNRNPSPEERLRSLPYLLRQIDLIQPKLILCLGKVSGTTLLDKDEALKNLRGKFYPFRNSLLTVTYHPAALLRNPKWKRPVWEDVQKVRKKVDELTRAD